MIAIPKRRRCCPWGQSTVQNYATVSYHGYWLTKHSKFAVQRRVTTPSRRSPRSALEK